MESLSVGKINFASKGKSPGWANIVPRHSAGISRQASAREIPEKEPVTILQLTSLSQASPMGSLRFDFSGNSGASEREPQIRALKVGSIRNGSGFMNFELFLRPKEEGFSGRAYQPSYDEIVCHQTARPQNDNKKQTGKKSGRGSGAREEFFNAMQAFFDALDGSCVGKSQITRRTESFTRH